jgi:hypothetical protein
MYVRPSAPVSIGGVVDDAIRLYRAAFSCTWKLSVGFGIALAVFGIVITLVVPGIFSGAKLTPQQAVGLFRSPVVIGTYALIFLIEIAFYGALLVSENAVARGAPVSGGQAVSAAVRRLPGMVLASLVFLTGLFVGCILLLIPGIWLWGKLQLWPAALFTEDASAMGALGSSWNLTKGRWWRTVTIVSVALIIVYVLTLAVGLVPLSLVALVGFKKGSILLAQLAALPFSILSRVLIMPAMPAVLLAVHHDSKLRSEGDDLVERTGALGPA